MLAAALVSKRVLLRPFWPSGRFWRSAAAAAAARSASASSSSSYDVVIVGGGVVGSALAGRLVQDVPSLKVALVEAGPGPNKTTRTTTTTNHQSSTPTIDTSRPPNPRSYALSLASIETLFGSGSNNATDQHDDDRSTIVSTFGGPYDTMQVWEEGQPAPLLWSARDDLPAAVTTATTTTTATAAVSTGGDAPPILGACFEDHVLQSLLWQKLNASLDNGSTAPLDVFINSTVQDVTWNLDQPDDWIRATIAGSSSSSSRGGTKEDESSSFSQRPDDVRSIRTRLLVAADGGRSRLRDDVFQIQTSRRINYQQSAVTATVRLETPGMMKGRAFQRFLDHTGPLALLPTRCPHHAVFVWSMPTATARQMIVADEQQQQIQTGNDDDYDDGRGAQRRRLLVDRLNEALQVGLEPIPRMSDTSSSLHNRWSLLPSFVQDEMDRLLDTLHYAPSLASSVIDRFRAAPRIKELATPVVSFPLATQMADTFTTKFGAVLIGDAAHIVHPLAGQGLNLGLGAVQVLADAIRECRYHDVRAALPAYEYHMQTHQTAAVASIHAIQRLFRESSILAKHGKSLGMNLVQSVPPLRKALVRAACFGSPM